MGTLKKLKLGFLAALLPFPGPAAMAGNGVERGDVSYSSTLSLPEPVSDFARKTIFTFCDLRGARTVSVSYVSAGRGPLGLPYAVTEYQIRFLVSFPPPKRQEDIFLAIRWAGAPGSESLLEAFALRSLVCDTDSFLPRPLP